MWLFKMYAIVLALVICGAFATPIPLAEEGRIIGGRPAVVGEFPYQVSLRSNGNGGHFCGGSIISNAWILTAAHCVVNMVVSDFVVVVGTNYLNSGGVSYNVAQITSHGSHNLSNNANDISLLRISGQIQGGDGIASIGLASSTTPAGANLVLSGWGFTSYPPNNLPNALQAINLRSISVQQCQSLLPKFPVYSTHVCTYMAFGQGTCRGDSGGPLVYGGVQHGIVSWGIPCAKGNPDVFTSVSAYRTWIRSVSGI